MATGGQNPKVDAYIAKARPFAQPILDHLRRLVHRACPGVEESIKWSRPFFEYKGTILCHVVAFKQHCTFGFWSKEMGAILTEAGVSTHDGKGFLDRITRAADLPPEKALLGWIRQAAALIDSGEATSPVAARNGAAKAPRPAPEPSPEFAAALRKNKKASAVFAAFSPSCRREYVEWIADAKRDETRRKRIAEAVEWIAEGKQRNWKYQ